MEEFSMQNYERALSATDTAMNSAGSGMRENEEYLQSLEARLNKLRNAWTELAINAGDALLSDGIIAFSESLASITSSGASAVRYIGFLPPVIGAVTIAVMALNSSIRTSTVVMGQKAGAATILQGALLRLTTGAVATGTAFATMGRFMMGAFPPLAIIMGVTFAVEKLFSAFMKYKQEQEEIEKNNKKSIESIQNQSSEIDSLVERYEKLASIDRQGNLNIEQEKEYVEIQNQLAEALPSVVQGFDDKNNAVLINSDLVKEQIELLKEQLELEKQSARLTLDSDIANINSNIKNGQSELEKLKKLQEQAYENHKAFVNEFGANSLEAETALNFAQKLSNQITEAYSTLDGHLNDRIQKFSVLINQSKDLSQTDWEWITSLSENSKTSNESIIQLGDTISSIRSAIGDAFSTDELKEFNNEQRQVLSHMANNLKNGTENFDSWADALNKAGFSSKEVEKAINSLNNALQDASQESGYFYEQTAQTAIMTKDLQELIDNGTIIYDKNGEAVTDLSDALNSLTESTNLATESFQELLKTYDSTSSEMSILNKLQEDMAKGHALTATEAIDLISKVDGLSKAISIENGQIKINEKAVEELRQTKMKSFSDIANSRKQDLINHANSTISKVNNYGLQIKAIQSVADAEASLADLQRQRSLVSTMGSFETRKQLDEQYFALKDLSEQLANIENLSNLASSSLNTVGTAFEENTKSARENAKATEAKSKATKVDTYLTDKYKNSLEALRLELDRVNRIKNQYPQHSQKYRNALEKEIKLQEQMLKLNKQQQDDIRNQIRTGNFKQTGMVSSNIDVPVASSSTPTSTSSSQSLRGWNGRQTSGYGMRNGKMHHGVDIANPTGTPLDSNVAGRVVYAGWGQSGSGYGNYGNVVAIKDADGKTHLFAHLDQVKASLGQYVEVGNQIGTIGNTGNSFGSHLHYEVRTGGVGQTINPQLLVNAARSGTVKSSPTSSAIERQVNSNNIQATQAQMRDQALSELNSLQQTALQIQDAIDSLELDKINSKTSQFLFLREGVERSLQRGTQNLQRYSQTSQEYRNELTKQNSNLKYQQDLLHKEANFIREQIARDDLSARVKSELNVQLSNLSIQWWDLNQAIRENNAEANNSKIGQLSSLIEQQDNALSHLQIQQESLSQTSDAYLASVTQEIKHLQEKNRLLNRQAEEYQKAISSGDLTTRATEEFKESLAQVNIELAESEKLLSERTYFSEVIVQTERYNKRLADLEYRLQLVRNAKDLLSNSVANYSDEISKQSELINEQIELTKDEIKIIQEKEKETRKEIKRIKELISLEDEGSIKKLELKGIYRDLTLEVQNYNGALQDSINQLREYADSLIDLQLTPYTNALSETDHAIRQTNQTLSLLNETSDEYSQALQDQIALHTKRQQELQLERSALEQLVQTEGLSVEKKAELEQKIRDNSSALLDNANAIKEAVQRVRDLTISLIELDRDAMLDDMREKFEKLNATLESLVSPDDIFDSAEFTRSLEDIIYELDKLDGYVLESPNFSNTSENVRQNLENTKNTISDFANVMRIWVNSVIETEEELERLIRTQSEMINQTQDEIQRINEVIRVRELEQKQTEDALRNHIENLNKELENLISPDEIFNIDEFSRNIDEIIYELDRIDNKFMENAQFVDSTAQGYQSLAEAKQSIIDIANAVEQMTSSTSDNQEGLESLIRTQSEYANQLKEQMSLIDQQIQIRQLEQRQIEDSLQNQIDLKQEQLKQLDEEYEKVDRNKRLQELLDEMEKVRNDRRFSFINEDGEEILTYDKGRLSELEKQRDELLEQYEREDIKKARQEEIDELTQQLQKTRDIHQVEINQLNLQKNALSTLYNGIVSDTQLKLSQLRDLQNNQLEEMQGIHQQELADLNLYKTSLETIYNGIVSDLNDKMSQLRDLQNQNLEDTQQNWNDLIESVRNGTITNDQLMSRYNEIMKSHYGTNINNLNHHGARIKELYTQELYDLREHNQYIQEAIKNGTQTRLEMLRDWQANELADLKAHTNNIQAEISKLAALYAQLAALAATPMPQPPSSSGGGGSGGSVAVGGAVGAIGGANSGLPSGGGIGAGVGAGIGAAIGVAKGKLEEKHVGGIIKGGKPNEITKMANSLFNAKPNEKIIKALKNEIFVPEHNITRNFIPNMQNLVSSIQPKVNAQLAQPIQQTTYHLSNFTIKAENPKQLFKDLSMYVRMNKNS